jgi:hypothetical protein
LHPALLSGFCAPDFLSGSLKLQVLDLVINECQGSSRRLVICSEFDRIIDLIEDLCVLRELLINRIQASTDSLHASVVLYNPKVCPFPTTAAGVDTLVMFDGGVAPAIPVRRLLHLVCTEGCESSLHSICCGRVPQDAVNCEHVCRTCICNGLVTQPDVPARDILRGVQSEPPELVQHRMAAQLMNGDVFGQLRGKMNQRHRTMRNVNDANWTGRERDELVRWLFRLGWGRWDTILERSGIEKSPAEVIRASRALLRYMVRVLSSPELSFALVRDFIRDSGTADDAFADRKFIDLSEFGNYFFRTALETQGRNLLKRLELLHTIVKTVDLYGPGRLQPPRAFGSPFDWWNEAHDQVLLLGTYHFGLGCYDAYCEDPRMLDIYLCNDFRKVDERLLRLAELMKRSFSLPPPPTAAAPKAKVRVRNSDPDYECRVDRPRMKPLAGQSDQLLRELLAQSPNVFEYAPKWRNVAVDSTPEFERSFFQAVTEKGVAAAQDVFAALGCDPPKRQAIVKRIQQLHEAAKRGPPPKPKPVVKATLRVAPGCELVKLGTVVTDRPAYHTPSLVFPGGYRVTRPFASPVKQGMNSTWVAEVVDGGAAPRFEVWPEED